MRVFNVQLLTGEPAPPHRLAQNVEFVCVLEKRGREISRNRVYLGDDGCGADNISRITGSISYGPSSTFLL